MTNDQLKKNVNYKIHLRKRQRQRELNELVESSHLLSDEKWSYVKNLPDEEKFFVRNHDPKRMRVFTISKSDKISISEIRELKNLAEIEQVICYARLKHYLKNGFSETYIY